MGAGNYIGLAQVRDTTISRYESTCALFDNYSIVCQQQEFVCEREI